MTTLDSPCVSGSKFSRCSVKQAGFPLECRRNFAFTEKNPFGVDLCARELEVVRRGEVCNRAEHAVCEAGTTCAPAPGVENIDDEDSTPPLAYCMKTASIGKDCQSTFDTVCENGLFCVSGKCGKGSIAQKNDKPFASDWVPCDEKPCAPGLECRTRFGRKFCFLKSVTVGLGNACYDKASKRRVRAILSKCFCSQNIQTIPLTVL